MTTNPYPKYIYDESSGEIIRSQHWEDWQAGYEAGRKDERDEKPAQ